MLIYAVMLSLLIPVFLKAADEGIVVPLDDGPVTIIPVEENGAISGASATGTIKASPQTVWSIITDHNNSAEFMPNIRKCRELKREQNEVWTETVSEAGLFTSTVIAHTIEFRERGLMTFRQIQGPFTRCEGTWVITDRGNGESTLTYQVALEHRVLPEWLKNMLVRRSLPDLFTGIRKRARQMAPVSP